MASSTPKILCMFMIMSLILPTTLATVYVVCDGIGWAVGADVSWWLSSLPAVVVGDTFYFQYEAPQTVAVVDEYGYYSCNATEASINDESCSFSYTFNETGVYYFISAAPEACTSGLQMQVLVL